jgi:hypothetical protein
MSNKSYQAECIECHKHFIAKKVRTRFCSNICRAKYSRDNRLKLIKSQSKTIKAQEKVIKKYDWWEKEQKRKVEHDAWLDQVLSGIIMPSISRYKAGTWTEYETKEFTRCAQIQGKTLDEYMRDLEARVPRMHPDIAKQSE